MAESSILMLKARDLLATPNHEGLAIVVDKLFMDRETDEYKSANALYDFCVDKFANLLTLKLLKVYVCSSSNELVRSRSIYLLSETLTLFRSRSYEFSRVSLYEIKPLLISCLTMQETREADIKSLRRVVSFVTYNVMMLDNSGWDELSECILELAINEPLKAFHIFIDLPRVDEKFIYRFMERILEEAEKVLLNPEEDRIEDWGLALQTIVKMGIQILDSEMKIDLIKNLLCVLVKSASELVEKGMEEFLLRGLEDLERFLSRDKNLHNYSTAQCNFVSVFMFKIRELGTHTNEAAKKINRLIKSDNNPAIKTSPSLIQQQPQEKQDSVLERGMAELAKSLTECEVDWMHTPEA
ncbi:unnamed protein product [Microthlaspi erraticum]|uniref:DUF577 domain-containing protein n=1 Tax=Microthlaspi erraticum TaxID=1685480 RepID=A0A6D2KFE8_9BRAS|nr:unnamed protein product [Microthlaspi erraticum]